VVTDKFLSMAKLEAAALGMPDLQFVVIPHPLAGLSASEVVVRARVVAEGVRAVIAAAAVAERGVL